MTGTSRPWSRGPWGKPGTCLRWKERAQAAGEQGAYLPWPTSDWARKVLDAARCQRVRASLRLRVWARTARVPWCEADLGDGTGVPRTERRRSLELGRERTRRHALPGFPAPLLRALMAEESSHPHHLAHRPSWGRGGHRGSRPGAGVGVGGRGRQPASLPPSSLPEGSISETRDGPKAGGPD